MRQGQNSKRSRGRGSGRRNNVPTRHQTVDSNGPSVRIHGSAFQVHEKYLTMARDAAATGDRIGAENYLQHAEHYFRIINVDNDGDGRGQSNPQRAERPQQEGRFAEGNGAGDAEEAVVEAVTPPQAAKAGDGAANEGGEQPAVEFPAGEDGAANGSAGEPAPAPRKPRVPRSPHARGPRAKRKPADDNPEPSQPEE